MSTGGLRPEPDPAPGDLDAVTALLGRVPNGNFVVVVRRRDIDSVLHGLGVVFLDDRVGIEAAWNGRRVVEPAQGTRHAPQGLRLAHLRRADGLAFDEPGHQPALRRHERHDFGTDAGLMGPPNQNVLGTPDQNVRTVPPVGFRGRTGTVTSSAPPSVPTSVSPYDPANPSR